MIVIFGPAGAGKSMQGKMLAERMDWVWLSPGELLRASHDPVAMQEMQTGELVDTEIINQTIGDALKENINSKNIIIDGFPRQPEQAKWLVDYCNLNNKKIELVINLEVPENEVFKRLSIRGRVDDTLESIKERIQRRSYDND